MNLVEYFEQGRWRSILYRAALSEMYVPYGDPSPTHNFKNVFDTGEVGIGVLANSLELGCDCLGGIHYFQACVNAPEGPPAPPTNATSLHQQAHTHPLTHLHYNQAR